MKDALIGIMVQMMPFMKPVMWIGAAAIAIGGLLLFLVTFSTGGARGQVRLAGTIAIAIGLFFLACQLAGSLLDVPPSINFGDSSKFQFWLAPFWQVGLAGLVPGLVLHRLGRPRAA